MEGHFHFILNDKEKKSIILKDFPLEGILNEGVGAKGLSKNRAGFWK